MDPEGLVDGEWITRSVRLDTHENFDAIDFSDITHLRVYALDNVDSGSVQTAFTLDIDDIRITW